MTKNIGIKVNEPKDEPHVEDKKKSIPRNTYQFEVNYLKVRS